MNIIAITSGGLDSTATYYRLLHEGHQVNAVFFNYGQRHADREYRALANVIPAHTRIDITFPDVQSALFRTTEVPRGEYNTETMKQTVVPFRNGVLLAYAIAIAEDRGAAAVAIGAHTGDHALYPDCTPEFTEAMSQAAQRGTYNGVKIIAPFMHNTKKEIVHYSRDIGIGDVIAKTYSCYVGGEEPCGECSTCRERIEAFW